MNISRRLLKITTISLTPILTWTPTETVLHPLHLAEHSDHALLRRHAHAVQQLHALPQELGHGSVLHILTLHSSQLILYNWQLTLHISHYISHTTHLTLHSSQLTLHKSQLHTLLVTATSTRVSTECDPGPEEELSMPQGTIWSCQNYHNIRRRFL